MQLSANTSTMANSDDLLGRTTFRLNQLGYRVRHFWISRYGDDLILHGHVGTHYTKQMVHVVVTEISGRRILSNDIRVD